MYCSTMGYDPIQHERFILGRAKEEVRHIIETIKRTQGQPPPGVQDLVERSLAASDWRES